MQTGGLHFKYSSSVSVEAVGVATELLTETANCCVDKQSVARCLQLSQRVPVL